MEKKRNWNKLENDDLLKILFIPFIVDKSLFAELEKKKLIKSIIVRTGNTTIIYLF